MAVTNSTSNGKHWFVPAICLGVLLIGFLSLPALQPRTDVDVAIALRTVYAEVNGERVEIPAEELSALPPLNPGQAPLVLSPGPPVISGPERSLYWQAAWPGPFAFIGRAGEWLQGLRPSARWDGPPSAIQTGPGGTTLRFVLVGGRTPARVDLVRPGSSDPAYALEIHSESRTLTWFKITPQGQEEQVGRGYYRPRGRASLVNAANDVLLLGMAASVLCILAWSAGVLLRRSRSRLKPQEDVSETTPGSASGRARGAVVPITLFLGMTLLASAAAVFVLDGIPHVQDEVGYLFQGKIFALARSYVPTPPGPEFFTNGFIQMFEGKWFAKYPPGFPLVLAPGLWAGLPWLIDPLCAGVALALVYASGLKMYGRTVALWAALLGLVSPWVIFMSGSYMSHPSTMMWVALLLYCLVCMPDAPRKYIARLGWPLLGGFGLGMAFITRQWTAAGIGVGSVLWVLGDIALAPGRERLARLGRYTLILVGMLPPVLLILYENRQLTGDWLRFTQDLVGSYDIPGFGPGHGDAQGHTPALGVYNALVYFRSLGSMFDGWPAPFALAPLLLGLFAWVGEKGRRALGWDALLWLGTLGLVAAYFVWWSNTTIFGPRYWYEAMPFLLLVAGRGMDLIGRIAGMDAPTPSRARALRWLVPAAVIAVFTLYNVTQSIPNGAAFYKDYNGISAAPLRNAEQAGLTRALIFVQLDPAKPNRDYGKVFAANDPLLRGDRVYARDLGVQRNRGLLQLFPGRRPYWLPLDGPPQPGFGP